MDDPSPPSKQYDGVSAQKYESGDVVWNSQPSAGEPIGQVCITSGTPGTPSPPTFSTFGEVTNVGKSTSYAADRLLAPTDRYVTVTATGGTMTLPASPVDGQTHSIKSKPDVTTTVDTEDPGPPVLKQKIDGRNSVTLAPGENGTFRYSAATGEWELR
jgi:hypothetical protein